MMLSKEIRSDNMNDRFSRTFNFVRLKKNSMRHNIIMLLYFDTIQKITIMYQ